MNIVTGMILDYRAFDTLGESTVLFTAAMVVLFLLRLDPESEKYSQLARTMREAPHADNFYEPRHDAILQMTAKILTPIVILLGIYVVLNGHLSPGRRLLRRRDHGRGSDDLRHGVRLQGYPPVLHL